MMRALALNQRAGLYGILSIWIMVFHLNLFLNPLFGNVYIGRAAELGECCVDVFLFISGYCIYHSWIRNPDYRSFLAKRVKRVVLPYILIATPYFIWKTCVFSSAGSFLENAGGFLYNLSGLSFLISGELDAWFPIAIMVFYLISPILIQVLRGKKGIWLFLVLFIITAILLNWSHYFSLTGIMWARLPAYSIGILFATHSQPDGDSGPAKTPSSRRLIPFIISTICLIILIALPVLTEVRSVIGGNLTKLVYFLLIFPILFFTNTLITVIPASIQNIFSFCGNLSLEIYLIHLFLIYVVAHYGWSAWLLPAALLLSIPLAVLVSVFAKKMTAHSFRHA